MKDEKIYLYETHLHTYPVSKCGRATVRETLEFYKREGYAGVFITNHFIDGNINIDRSLPYEERIRFYFSDYEDGVEIGKEIGLPVFCGVEMSYRGADFLVYGLDKEWFLAHPEIRDMKKTEELPFLMEHGALVIHAHPFRNGDQIRLFPHFVHGVEIYNASRNDLENSMAKLYAENYGLPPFAGSDNHSASRQNTLGGIKMASPIFDEADFVERIKAGEYDMFKREHNIKS